MLYLEDEQHIEGKENWKVLQCIGIERGPWFWWDHSVIGKSLGIKNYEKSQLLRWKIKRNDEDYRKQPQILSYLRDDHQFRGKAK